MKGNRPIAKSTGTRSLTTPCSMITGFLRGTNKTSENFTTPQGSASEGFQDFWDESSEPLKSDLKDRDGTMGELMDVPLLRSCAAASRFSVRPVSRSDSARSKMAIAGDVLFIVVGITIHKLSHRLWPFERLMVATASTIAFGAVALLHQWQRSDSPFAANRRVFRVPRTPRWRRGTRG